MYQYDDRPVSDWHNVTNPGLVIAKAYDSNSSTLSFTFFTPIQDGSICWAGNFQGTLVSVDGCRNELIGTYDMKGGNDECYSPRRLGTFSFHADRCG